jgi:hypothetical protein
MGHFPSTWLAQILPQIEQQNLWDQAKTDYQFDPSPFTSHLGMRTPVNVYACPSDPQSGQAHWTHENRIVASTNYLGVNGTNYLEQNGVFYLNSETTWASVKDGQSNTLMIGERPPSPDYWYGWWYAGYGREGSGAPDMLLGVAELNNPASDGSTTYLESCPPGPYQFTRGSSKEQCDTMHFWSHHPGGANFANCDASIQFLSYSTDASVMHAIATRADQEIFESPWQ